MTWHMLLSIVGLAAQILMLVTSRRHYIKGDKDRAYNVAMISWMGLMLCVSATHLVAHDPPVAVAFCVGSTFASIALYITTIAVARSACVLRVDPRRVADRN